MAVLAAITLTLAITATAMSVDIGHQVNTERRLEGVVDLAAQDASEAIGNRRDPAQNPYTQAYGYATQNATNNSFDYANSAAGNAFTVELGIADPNTKVFTPFPDGASVAVLETANAVRVTGTTKTNYAFMPGSGATTAQSVVLIQTKKTCCTAPCTGACGPACCITPTQQAAAAFSIGSDLGSYSSSASLLNPVLGGFLGGSVNLSAVSYTGLASADVTLGKLWTQLGLDAGSTTDVLNTGVTVANLLQAEADLLNAQGDAASVAAATSLLAMKQAADPSLQFTFGDILDLGVNTPGSAADSSLNVLSLASAAAEVANGAHAITFNLPVSVPGVTSGTVTMSMVEAPVLAAGPAQQAPNGNWLTTAHTGQARLYLNLNLANGITVGTTTVPVRLPVYVEAGSADAQLTDIACEQINTNSTVTVATQTQALSAYIGDVSSSAMSNTSTPVTVSPATMASAAGLVTVTGYGTTTVAGSSSNLTFNGTYSSRVQHTGATSITLHNLSSSSNFTVSPIGLSTATVATQLHTLTDPVLSNIETLVLDPLAATPLGITLGGADVANPSADCLYGQIIG